MRKISTILATIAVLLAYAEDTADAIMEELKAEEAPATEVGKAETNAAKENANEAAVPTASKATTSEVAPAKDASGKVHTLSTQIFRLNHCSAAEVAAKFNEMWNGEFGQVWKVTKMAVDFPESNSVMVTAPPTVLEACAKAIELLDVEARQVYIEARFVELSNNASHKLGIDWQMLDSMSGSIKLAGGFRHNHIGRGVTDYTTSTIDSKTTTAYGLSGVAGSNGNLSFFNGTLDFSEMSLILRALESIEDAKTFSNPKIIVSSGKKAIVDMTEKYPNVKISAKRTTSGSGSDSLDLDMQMSAIPGEDKFMFAKEAFFSWGILLEVTPRVSTNGLINVSIVPTISECTDFVTAGTTADSSSDTGSYSAKYPVINVQRLITEFNLASETTAVIGGLSRTIEKQVDNGIPVLRDIPWLGRLLFGSKSRVKEQREIIVFVTVGLVEPAELRKDAGLPKNAVLGRQYVEGWKLEPGDRPRHNMEGLESLDLRDLEKQAQDPLSTNVIEKTTFISRLPFINLTSL